MSNLQKKPKIAGQNLTSSLTNFILDFSCAIFLDFAVMRLSPSWTLLALPDNIKFMSIFTCFSPLTPSISVEPTWKYPLKLELSNELPYGAWTSCLLLVLSQKWIQQLLSYAFSRLLRHWIVQRSLILLACGDVKSTPISPVELA